MSTMSYTGFDKVGKVRMGNDSLVYTYGYGHQRIAMEEHAGNTVRTKRYVGACERVTETMGSLTTDRWLTYLTGPTGVYAVVVTVSGTNTLHYILKDNLGSLTTITDSDGVVEQRLSYDAWGNLRDPNTWSGSFTGTPMFDRGFTGHEHLYNFGLINMNGRMYDPVMSSFLSVDQYVQDPSSAQGFNRYAYCGHNPLRYVDPTGWRKQEPIPGRTPTSDDSYRDIYTYVERALEPRDLGILQLPTDDPSVVWMEENEMHGGGGGEPIIDPSKLTASQQKDFDYTISYASENSSLFKKILDCLTNSKTTYSIIIGKTYNNVPAEFQQKTNALVFRDEGTLLSLLDMVEEMFHEYQSENIELYNTNEFNYEFEAKVARYFIMEQVIGLHETSIGTNFEIMHGFLSPNGIDVLFPTSQSIKSSNFLKCYYEGALYFREWNIINNYGNDNYKKMTLQTPKSLFELFKQ
jgi:RHS repeat-associated protein